MLKRCLGCKVEKHLDEFNLKDKDKGTRQSRCKDCTRLQVRKHYQNNRKYYLNKAKKRNKFIRETIRQYIWNYLSKNPCIDCGEKDISVLTFDHVRDKKANIADMIHFRNGVEMVQKEIEKCVVRCANCHMRKTARDFKWGKYNLVTTLE